MCNRVVLDLDNVVFDFDGAFCKKFGWENRELVCLEHRYPDRADEIELFVQNPATYGKLDVLSLGTQIAKYCDENGMSTTFVSNRAMSAERITGIELKKNKIPFFSYSVGRESESPKLARIAEIAPLFVVDDMLRVAEGCADISIPCFLVDQPWNFKENLHPLIYRITTFSEFLEKFDQLTRVFV